MPSNGSDLIRFVTALAELRELDGRDPEYCHIAADNILLQFVPWQIAEEYNKLVERCSWWAHA